MKKTTLAFINKFILKTLRKLGRLSIVFFIVYFLFASCTKLTEEELMQGNICDTTNVNYAKVALIFNSNCVSCHNTGFTNEAEIVLDSYEKVVISVNTGLLIKAINHLPEVTPMPYGLSKLAECDINTIEAWVNNGMPE